MQLLPSGRASTAYIERFPTLPVRKASGPSLHSCFLPLFFSLLEKSFWSKTLGCDLNICTPVWTSVSEWLLSLVGLRSLTVGITVLVVGMDLASENCFPGLPFIRRLSPCNRYFLSLLFACTGYPLLGPPYFN